MEGKCEMPAKGNPDEDTTQIHERLTVLETTLKQMPKPVPPSRMAKIIEVGQTIALVIILPWATWVTQSVFTHNGKIDLLQQWQDNRPKFVTASEQDVAILKAQEKLREERAAMFSAIQADLKELLRNQGEIRIQLERHMSAVPPPRP